MKKGLASRTAGLVCLLLSATAPVPAAGPPTLPFSQVEAGMRGVGRTVFSGTTIEEFDVEILGKLPNIGPDQSLILARLSGGSLAETGVLAGMSGSPVTIDGRLIGAIAYSWKLSTEPIAGITPIDEMLAIATGDSARRPVRAGRVAGLPAIERLLAPAGLADFYDSELRALLPRSGAVLPVALPLSVTGIGPYAFERVRGDLVRAGFIPLLSGTGSGSSAPPPRLEPG